MSKVVVILLVFILSSSKLLADDIPVIVIAPGKSIQSYNTVGSSVSVIDANTIESSQDSFLADVLNNNTTSMNLFQMGGQGTNTGIQIRGFEKRYATIYIDGIKMNDPSTTDNSFYTQDIMKHSIDKVEILKGSQSSLYGANAIGGTINIFTKKGKEGKHSNIEVSAGNNNTKSIFYSLDGADDKVDYYIGLNKFDTDGISAMNDNKEQDSYRNDSVTANLGYKISNNLKVENLLRYSDSFLNYDEVNNTRTDLNNSTDNTEVHYSLRFINEKDKFKNTIIYNKSYIERNTTGYLADAGTGSSGYETYYGYRDVINFLGEYNFNLDNRIVYGLDNEFDAAKYPDGANNKLYSDEAIYSQFLDYQFRPLEKLYATFGIRQDTHTTVGDETTHRATIAYQLDNNSKIRASYGTGVRFPALYDYFYGGVESNKEKLKAEEGESFDIGYETYLDKFNLGLNVSLFKLKQTDPIVNQSRTGWLQMNAPGTNESEGIEFSTNWKPDDIININFNYTFTDSFDSANCENPDRTKTLECFHEGTQVDQAKVRVPKHAFNASINYEATKNLKHSLLVKYSGERRDFGNVNNGWADVILKEYILFDVASSYNLWNSYKIGFSARNIFDEGYEQAYEYSGMERSINFDIKKIF